MTQFYHCLTYWLLSRPFDLILSLCTQMTPFKTFWSNFIIVYPIDSFQDHLTQFYHCVPNLLFKTIWPHLCIVYPIDFFQDHMIWFLCCPPIWLLSRPFALILSSCTQLTPFKTIWGKEVKWSWKESVKYTMQKSGHWIKWSWKESLGYTMIKLDQMVLKGVNWVQNTNIGVTFLGKW